MKLHLIRWRPGGLARHGSVLLGWMLLRAAAQVATIVMLARQLGADSYGQFVALIAASSFFTPFVGLGLSHVLLRNAARDPAHHAVYLRRALYWWVRTLPFCAASSLLLVLWLLPGNGSLVMVCAVVVAELTAASLAELCARYWQSRQKTGIYGTIHAALPGIRLLALGLLLVSTSNAGTTAVLWTYAASSLIYAAVLLVTLPSNAEFPDARLEEPMTAQSGLPFCVAAFAMKLQSEFSKPVLAQAGLGLAGVYNVAQRAVDIASLPLAALQETLWPRLYAQADPARQLRRTGTALLALALALGLALCVLAPLLPMVLGASFAGAVDVLQMLALLPFLQVLRGLLNFGAIHRGRMQESGRAYTVGGIVSGVAVAALVPPFGVKGAAVAAYVAEAVMIALLLFDASRGRRHPST